MTPRRALGLVAIVLAAVALWPAGAEARFFGGVVPDVGKGSHRHVASMASAGGLSYYGGPVLHTNRTHVIFWQPAGSRLAFDPGYRSTIRRFLGDVARDSRKPTNVYGLSGQYHDLLGPAAYASRYWGSVLDTDPLPPNGCSEPPLPPAGDGPGWRYCLSDAQLEDEVVNVVRGDGLPVTLRDVYFLVLPNGLGGCQFGGPENCALGGPSTGGYCGYHSSTIDGYPYAVIPYNAIPGHCESGNPRPNATTADPAISTISHEHNEVVTDPLGNAWTTSSGEEDGDLCFLSFGPSLGGQGAGVFNQVIAGHHYYLQSEWSNDDHSCQPRDEADRVWFRTAAAGRGRVRFIGHASDRDGSIAAYLWTFGDDTIARRRVSTHTFRRPRSYRVTLRITDRSGNWAFSTRRIRVR